MNLFRQHFYQCIEILRFGKEFKVPAPKKVMNLPKKNPDFKTIFLDLDETLIHCDERSNNYTVKLNFPIDKGGIIAVIFILFSGRSQDPQLLQIVFRRVKQIRINHHIHCKQRFICRCDSRPYRP